MTYGMFSVKVGSMIQYPLQFKFSSEATSGIQVSWKTHSEFNAGLVCTIPPEFEGPGGGLSPEDLFGLAILNCFVATFKVFSEKSKLEFQRLDAKGILSVDRDEKGAPWMKAMQVEVSLAGVQIDQKERALRLLEKTSQSCIVARSVKTEVSFKLKVD
jgi:organic hydroperoxide reductase OsmC/OhrA